jgi:hypothetical protein
MQGSSLENEARIKIDEITISERDRYRRDLGDIARLAKSVSKVGLIHPIVVNSRGELVVGLRRLLAARLLGWKEIPATVIDIDTLRGERAENIERKPPTASERVRIGRKAEGEIGSRQGQRTDKGLPQELGEAGRDKGPTRDFLKNLGKSRLRKGRKPPTPSPSTPDLATLRPIAKPSSSSIMTTRNLWRW